MFFKFTSQIKKYNYKIALINYVSVSILLIYLLSKI